MDGVIHERGEAPCRLSDDKAGEAGTEAMFRDTIFFFETLRGDVATDSNRLLRVHG